MRSPIAGTSRRRRCSAGCASWSKGTCVAASRRPTSWFEEWSITRLAPASLVRILSGGPLDTATSVFRGVEGVADLHRVALRKPAIMDREPEATARRVIDEDAVAADEEYVCLLEREGRDLDRNHARPIRFLRQVEDRSQRESSVALRFDPKAYGMSGRLANVRPLREQCLKRTRLVVVSRKKGTKICGRV